jgi:1A family penicillin-binding protein
VAYNGNGRPHGNGRQGSTNGNGTRHRVPPVWFVARKRRRAAPPPSKLPYLFAFALLLGGGLLTAVLMGGLLTFQTGANSYEQLNAQLPPLTELTSHETFKTAQIYDRRGNLLYEFYHEQGGRRTIVPISEISQNLIDATLAAEDANFYANPGVDAKGIARALMQNVSNQGVVSGASTITQQLVKNVLIPPEERSQQTLSRKAKEAILAYQVSQQFSKSQILEMYLNEIFYGNLAYGAEAAAQTYYGKHARDLSVAEASLLAGLPQAPSGYDPFRNLDAARQRQRYVLDQMARHGFITQDQADQAWDEQLVFKTDRPEIKSPHFSYYVKSLVEQKYGDKTLYQGGLKIYTTLDSDLQHRLEAVAKGNQDVFDKWHANNTTIVALDPRTGEVLAMVGSRDYYDESIDGQVNMAVAERQPGSSIKPLVYSVAFTKGWGPYTVIDDSPSCWIDNVQLGRKWCPQNYDLKFHGPMTVRSALGNSINIPAVKTLEFASIDSVRDQAKKQGITTWDDKYLGLSLTLGGAEVEPLELAGVYTTFANNGLFIPPVSITKIVDAYGEVLEEYKVPQGEPLLDPRIAYQISNMLSDNNARLITFGPNNILADFDRPVAAKTGTTDNYRDTWTMGYTPNLVVGVWFGNTDGTPMVHAISSLSAGKIWHDAMQAALEQLSLPAEQFQRPEGLVERDFCGPGISVCPYKELWLSERQKDIPKVAPRPAAPPAASPTPGQPGNQPAGQPTAQPAPAAQPQPTAAPARNQAPPPQPTRPPAKRKRGG